MEEESFEKKTEKKYKTDLLTKFDPFFQAGPEQFWTCGQKMRKRQLDIILKLYAEFKV